MENQDNSSVVTPKSNATFDIPVLDSKNRQVYQIYGIKFEQDDVWNIAILNNDGASISLGPCYSESVYNGDAHDELRYNEYGAAIVNISKLGYSVNFAYDAQSEQKIQGVTPRTEFMIRKIKPGYQEKKID